MNFVSIEAPATRVAAAREFLELLDALLGVVAASQLLQVVADQLIEALPKASAFFRARATSWSSMESVTFH